MGNCLQRSADPSENPRRSRRRVSSRRVTVGKNQPLKKHRIKWTSDVQLTIGQVMSKREEFWDTAPAFEGRQEIWDALRAAAEALEKSEYDMAQAFVDGANIIVPTGTLCDCYDELGNRYQLPPYVLSFPLNMTEKRSDGGSGDGGTHAGRRASGGDSAGGGKQVAGRGQSGEKSGRSSRHHGGKKSKRMKEEAAELATTSLRFRLSTGREFKLTVRNRESVSKVKQELAGVCNFPAERQRWYCYGQVLTDRYRIEECQVPAGFVIQVVVHTPDEDISEPPEPVDAPPSNSCLATTTTTIARVECAS